MSLSQIKHAIRLLPLTQLKKLDEWLHDLIRKAEEANRKERPPTRKSSLAEQIIDNKTYRLEGVRCGKENCKCARGKPHGPYWYSYVRVKDRLTSQYVGKNLPKHVEKKLRDQAER